jgi:transposase
MDGNGYPLAFSLFPGNESEQPSLKKLESKIIKDFRHSKMVVCTDAGLASASNRRFNSIGNRAFITTQSIKKLKSDIREWCLSPVGWKLLGSSSDKLYDISKVDESVHEGSIFYKESPYTDAQGTRQSLIVTYSIRYRRYCRVIRDGQISRAMRLIEKGQKKLKNNPNAPSRFIREESFNSETGEVSDGTSLSLDSEKIRSEAMYDGFYAVCTNLEDSVERVVDISRRRWEIEESFRILKSEFSARPVFLSRKDRITAHFLVCFIALLIYRILEHRLDEKYTVSEIVGTLRSMEFQHVPGEGYIPAYTRTDLTDSLHELFGFRTDHEITSEKNMKKIIKQTKAKNITRN